MSPPLTSDNEYFGYNIETLRMLSEGDVHHGPYKSSWYSDTFEDNKDSGPVAETPAPDSDEALSSDIESINLNIMGEQPGSADARADQWANVSAMLSLAGNQLRTQTNTMAGEWESPAAKDAFLSEVGKTLAYLDVWHSAASANSFALRLLAEVMREAQDDMRALYERWRQAKSVSLTQYELAQKGFPGGNYELNEERKAGKLGEDFRTFEENKEAYSKEARILASETATKYAPILQRLESARAKMMTPLNAVEHPEAYGFPTPDTVTTVAPGVTPTNAPPWLSANPVPALQSLRKLTTPDAGNLPKTTALKQQNLTTPEVPALPDGPTVQPLNALTTPDVPNADALRSLGVPGAVPPVFGTNSTRLANVTPDGLNGLNGVNGLNANMMLGGATTLGTTSSLSSLSSLSALNGTLTSSAQAGLQPPGGMSPPPGAGVPNKAQQKQGKVLGDKKKTPGTPGTLDSPASPPPGGTPQNAREAPKAGGSSGTSAPEAQEAFTPPPAANASSVLGNSKQKRIRPGSAREAPGAHAGLGGATPPVLSNPHRKDPAKTHSEQRAERRQNERKRAREQSSSEFATGLSTPTAPVFEGRTAPARGKTDERASEVPAALRGPAPTAPALDQHTAPQVQADRTTRAPHQPVADVPVTDQTPWEVQTPGGPVVAGGPTPEQHHRPEPTLNPKPSQH